MDLRDGFKSVGIEHFGIMIPTTFQLLHAKIPYNFGKWKDCVDLLATLWWFATLIELNTCKENGVGANEIVSLSDPTTNTTAMAMTTQGDVVHSMVKGFTWGSSYGYKILKGHGWKRKSRFVPHVCSL